MHLFLALGRLGWGEASLGINIAEKLVKQGDQVIFIIHKFVEPLFSNNIFQYETIDDSMGPFFQIWLDEFITEKAFDSIVLCDFFTTNASFEVYGIDPAFLLEYPFPAIVVDTWDYTYSGNILDFAHTENIILPNWIEKAPLRLIPSPFAKPDKREGIFACHPLKQAPSTIKHNKLKQRLSIPEDHKLILYCSADWQQTFYNNPHCLRLSKKIPELLEHYFNQLEENIHIVHVGPKLDTFDTIKSSQYHWLGKLESKQFESLFNDIDLFLSINISARSITHSIVNHVPVLVLQNSFMLNHSTEFIPIQTDEPKSYVMQWLEATIPLYPFYMWPLGFYSFLNPVMKNNPYLNAIKTEEILDMECVLKSINNLLFDETHRKNMLLNQQNYIEILEKLPSPVDYINNLLNNIQS